MSIKKVLFGAVAIAIVSCQPETITNTVEPAKEATVKIGLRNRLYNTVDVIRGQTIWGSYYAQTKDSTGSITSAVDTIWVDVPKSDSLMMITNNRNGSEFNMVRIKADSVYKLISK